MKTSPLLAQSLLDAADAADVGVLVTARDHQRVTNVFANQAMARMFGTTVEQILTQPTLDFVAQKDRERAAAFGANVRAHREQGPSRLELEGQRADGSSMPLEWTVLPVTLDGEAYLLSLLKSGAKLRQAQDAFQRLIDAAPDGVVISRQGVVQWANRAAAMLLGYADGGLLTGKSLAQVLHPDDAQEMMRRIRAMAETGERFSQREYRAVRTDGSQVVAEITSLIIDWEGAPAVLAFARDVTARATMVAQLAQTERLAALGTLAAGVAHEINNPMAAVLFGVEAIDSKLRRPVLDEKTRAEVLGLLADLKRGAERVTRISRDLTVFARGGDDSVQAIDLAAVVESASRLSGQAVRERANLSVMVGQLPKVLGNTSRTEQVLVNLLINAMQAMPQERDIVHNRIEVTASVDGGRVVLDVKDNGSGIDPAHLPHVFEPFFTTKAIGIGTGLGLSICHGLVQQMGGDIQVDSELGKGTRVSVALKIA